MLIGFSALVLASQLFMTVADEVPKFDITRGCRADATNTSGLNVGQDETTKNCIRDEQTALGRFRRSGSNLLRRIERCVLPIQLTSREPHPATLIY